MNAALIGIIGIKIKSTFGTQFQDLIDEILAYKYGSDYKPIKPKHDQGSDGIVETTKTVIASYAPELYDLEKFKKKIHDDYTSYTKHWRDIYPNWTVIYNDEVRAGQEKYVNSLSGSVWGLKTIIKIIEDLDSSQIRKIAKYLKVDDIYLTNDYLSEILDDLLKDSNVDSKLVVIGTP